MAVSRFSPKVCKIKGRKPRKNDDQSKIVPAAQEEIARVAEEIQAYLTNLHRSEKDKFQFPGDMAYEFNLGKHTELECPSLYSYFSVASEFGNVCSGSVEIQADNVEDILGVLLVLNVSSFKLRHNVPEEYVGAVQDFFSTNPSLRKLYIFDHYLRQDQQLVRSIMKSSKSLSFLDICADVDNANTTTRQSLNDYIRTIPECHYIETLKLGDCYAEETLESIADLLAQQSSLKSLDMSKVGEAGDPIDILKIAQALKNNESLQELDLRNQRLASDDCIIELVKALESNKSLKRLHLQADGYSRNYLISPDAWATLGSALAKNHTLEYLDISSHQISESSWMAFAEGLKCNQGLITLKAAKWPGEDDQDTDCLLPMFDMLRENQTIRILQMARYNLSNSLKSLEALASALAENRTLKSLNLEGSWMTEDGIEVLSRCFPKMKGLEHLNLNYHNFSQKGAQTLAAAIRDNFSILTVEAGQLYCHGHSPGYVPPLSADGFEKEYHEIQYYSRLNRKGRRCLCQAPLQPSLWSLVLARALRKEKPLGPLASKDVRREDKFAGNHDTSIDAVYFLLRNVMTLPVATENTGE